LDFKKLWQHSLGMSCSTESAPWHQFAFAVTRSTNSHWDMATCLGNRSDWKGIDWWSKMHREKSWTSWTNAQNAQNAQNAKICQVFPVFMHVSSCFVHVFVFVIFCVVLVGLLHSECWAPQTCPIRHLRPNLHFYSSPAVAAPETRSEQKRCARCVGDVPCHDQFTVFALQVKNLRKMQRYCTYQSLLLAFFWHTQRCNQMQPVPKKHFFLYNFYTCSLSRFHVRLQICKVNFHNANEAETALDTLSYTNIHGRCCRLMWSA
jgi:hypothetical protein